MDDPTTKPSGSNPASPSSTYSETDRSDVETPAGTAPAVCASLPAAASGSQVAAPSAGLLLKSGMRLSFDQIQPGTSDSKESLLLQGAAVLSVDPGGGAAHPAGDLPAGAEKGLKQPVDELLVGVLGARDGHVDRGRHGVAGLPDRGGDRAQAGDRLVPLDEVAVLPGRFQLRAQRVDGGDRLRAPGAAERVGGHPLAELVGAEVGEDHLADGAEHRRDRRAYSEVRRHQRVATGDAGHEQDLVAVEDPEVDGLAGLRREVAQHRL